MSKTKTHIRLWIPKRKIEQSKNDDLYYSKKDISVFEALKSSVPSSIPFGDEDLIESFLIKYRKIWFNNPKSDFYKYKQSCKATAKYWLEYNKHSSDHNDKNIAYIQNIWDYFVKNYESIEY